MPNCSPKWLYQFILPPVTHNRSCCFISFSTFGIVILLNCQLNWCKGVAPYGLGLYFPDSLINVFKGIWFVRNRILFTVSSSWHSAHLAHSRCWVNTCWVARCGEKIIQTTTHIGRVLLKLGPMDVLILLTLLATPRGDVFCCPVLQRTKTRHREVKWLVWGHTAG